MRYTSALWHITSFIFYAVIFGLRAVLVLCHGMFYNVSSSLNFVEIINY